MSRRKASRVCITVAPHERLIVVQTEPRPRLGQACLVRIGEQTASGELVKTPHGLACSLDADD